MPIKDPFVKTINKILKCHTNQEDRLDLSFSILDRIPPGLNLLLSVKKLLLRGNTIPSVKATDLPPNLEELDVSRNCLTSFSPELVSHLKSLKVLLLEDNLIKDFEFEKFVTLEKLDLSYNDINDIDSFPPNIKELYLADNSVIELPPIPPNIVKLNISLNVISEITFAISDLSPSLEHIDFSESHVSSMPFLPSSTREVFFSGNNISLIEKEHLPESLITFVGNSCNIDHIITDSFPPNLEVLDLSDNRLDRLPGVSMNIKKINVSCNFLDEISEMSLSLKKLDVSDNRLTEIPEQLMIRADSDDIELKYDQNLIDIDNIQDGVNVSSSDNQNGENQNVIRLPNYQFSQHSFNTQNFNLRGNINRNRYGRQYNMSYVNMADIFSSKNADENNPYCVSVRNTKHLVV